MTVKNLLAEASNLPSGEKMPVFFVGHGNPMNAILENDITAGWKEMGKNLNPSAILCISAHWETRGTRVTMAPKPRTIHDFGGFLQELFDVQYPAPGSPEIARSVIDKIKNRTVEEDHEWGLDHGTWSVLVKMFPKADVPVFQLSLNYNLSPKEHYELAEELGFLRQKGVLIVGSGNIVHNLRMAKWNSNEPYDWAVEFDQQMKNLILDQNHRDIIKAGSLNREAGLSIPTPDHYLPVIYTLALQDPEEQVTFFNEKIEMGSMSMRSFVIS